MNNNKTYKWLAGLAMVATLTASMSSCSDDHFDISPDAAGKLTIWESIRSNSNLSQYADILENVYYSQTEEKVTPETYADVLDGNQTFTVWAPQNDSFNYEYYKALLETGNRDSIYKVEKELIRNNMTRYNHAVIGSDSVKLSLFNNKAAWLNYDKQTIKGVSIIEPNVGTSNGVLHITSGAVAYQPNLYEFLATRSELDSINAFIKGWQTLEFDENSSTQGPTIDGQVTWVDSITYVSNGYTTGFMNARLDKEDSSYVMLLPTNEAWKTTLAKTIKFFHFKNSYKQDVHTQTEAGADTLISGAETTFTPAELDSLVNLYSKNAITQHLTFNANWQYEKIPISSINDLREADVRKDSIVSTAGMKFKKTGTLNGTNTFNTVEVDSYETMFGNTDPVEVSNGYAYIVNDFTYPSTIYAPNLDLDARMYYESCDNMCNPSTRQWSIERHIETTDDEGNVIASRDSTYSYNYMVMNNTTGTAHPGAYFKIPNVLSCKYDIFVVIGYNTEADLQNMFTVAISYDNENKRETDIILLNPNEDAINAQGASLYNQRYFVNKKPIIDDNLIVNYTDTICVAKDFEFPVSYYNLENAYPVIRLKSNFTTAQRDFYSRVIWVNSIILRPKED